MTPEKYQYDNMIANPWLYATKESRHVSLIWLRKVNKIKRT